MQSDQVNPPGLNCKNGVLRIEWDGKKPQFELVPHDSRFFYTYAPIAEYNLTADPTDCDRLLDVLSSDQQEVFLRTISAAFDIDTVRRFHGRSVRALLCKGVGSNGKDALREAVSLMWGKRGMTSISLEDFAAYDGGRKFGIASLASSRINWSSENSRSVSIDTLQSLKRAITGDPLHQEFKGRDHKEFKPRAIHLFNVNDVPYLKGAQVAIQSRFAILSFNKVFRKNADPSRGELEVDPRFKDDAQFVEDRILPALLNRTIAAFESLMAEGIDFASCDEAMKENQISQSHLYEFALESGLVDDRESVMQIGELWMALESYYKDTGVLTVEFGNGREYRDWQDPVRPGDLYVKGQNQIAQRFIALYPQCQKVSLGKNRFGIKGLAFRKIEAVPEVEASKSPFEPDIDSHPPDSTALTTWLNEANVANLAEMAQIAIDDDTPHLIEQIFEPVPKPLRSQVQEFVMRRLRV